MSERRYWVIKKWSDRAEYQPDIGFLRSYARSTARRFQTRDDAVAYLHDCDAFGRPVAVKVTKKREELARLLDTFASDTEASPGGSGRSPRANDDAYADAHDAAWAIAEHMLAKRGAK